MTPTLRQADLSLPGLLRQLDAPAGVLSAAVAGYAEARIAHNTSAYASKQAPASLLTVGVVLHSTVIARFTRIEGGSNGLPDLWLLTVNTGGWDTVTTRDRLNRVLRPLGITIYRDRGVTVLDGVVVDGELSQKRPLLRHDWHHLPVATVLADGTRVVPPYLPADQVEELATYHVPVASLTAAVDLRDEDLI